MSAVEHDGSPKWDAPTQAIPAVPPSRHAAAQPPLHRDQSTNPDVVAVRMIRVCSQALDEHWSSTRLQDALLTHSGELHRRAQREQEGGETIRRRTEAARRVPQDVAAAIEAAVLVEHVTGVPVDLDPQAMGRGLTAMTANAHDLTEQTMVGLPRITDDMPDPRKADGNSGPAAVEVTQVPAPPHPWDAVAGTDGMVRSDGSRPSSPVHRDDTAPPVPHQGAEPASRALPKRHRVLSIPARMSAVPGVPADGSEYAATELLVLPGAWMFASGAWSLVESASVDSEKRVVAQPAEGDGVVLEPGAPVWLLAPGEAVGLVEAFRAGLNGAEAPL